MPVVVLPLLRDPARYFSADVPRGWNAWWVDLRRRGAKTHIPTNSTVIEGAAAVVALGPRESESLRCAFHVPELRVAIIENWIAPEFFRLPPNAFCKLLWRGARIRLVRGLHQSAQESDGIGVARAGAERLVLVGGCLESQRSYLAELEAMPHVRYVGGLNYGDRAPACLSLCGCFRARHRQSIRVMPLCVLEALAAGTPAVMTRNHSMDLTGISYYVYEANLKDGRAIGDAVRTLCALQFDRKAISAASSRFSWASVAARCSHIYRRK